MSAETSTKPTLLVVDDERDNLELLFRALRRDFHVLTASSGAEALALLQRHPEVGLIVTDQRMPGMTGVELLRAALPIVPHALRVILTGYTGQEDAEEATSLGQVHRFILKPVEPGVLREVLRQLLAQERPSGGAHGP